MTGSDARLTAAQLLTMRRPALERAIADDFANLVTLAVAEAVERQPPQHIARMLRSRDLREDWRDALLCAAGELQVAAERMAYLDDPRLESTQRRLQRVRMRSHAAAALIAEKRKAGHAQISSQFPEQARNPSDLAYRWLSRVYRDEYRQLTQWLRAGRTAERLPPSPTDGRVGVFEQAIGEGWIEAPITPRVTYLRECDDDRFRRVVGKDANSQNTRVIELRHPLLLDRWHEALQLLATDTLRPAQAAAIDALGPLAVDLNALAPAEAYAVLNARRFLTVLHQRRIECRRWLRVWMATMTIRRDSDPRYLATREVQRDARHLLAEQHDEDYARLRAALFKPDGRWVVRAGMPQDEFIATRERILREVFPGYDSTSRHSD